MPHTEIVGLAQEPGQSYHRYHFLYIYVAREFDCSHYISNARYSGTNNPQPLEVGRPKIWYARSLGFAYWRRHISASLVRAKEVILHTSGFPSASDTQFDWVAVGSVFQGRFASIDVHSVVRVSHPLSIEIVLRQFWNAKQPVVPGVSITEDQWKEEWLVDITIRTVPDCIAIPWQRSCTPPPWSLGDYFCRSAILRPSPCEHQLLSRIITVHYLVTDLILCIYHDFPVKYYAAPSVHCD